MPAFQPWRWCHVVLLGATAAGTAGLLLVSPLAPADTTVPLLVVALGALGLLVAVEHRRPRLTTTMVLVAATGLLAVAMVRPPHGSHDVWSYAMYGRMVAHHGANPYTHRPVDFPGDPILRRVDWRHSRSVYGPGFTMLSAAIMAVAGINALVARVGFQLLAAGSVLAIGLVLVRARVPRAALAALLLNPLIVVSVVNGAHNDALVGLALVGAAMLLRRRRPTGAGLCLAAASLVKIVAVVPAAAAVAWTWRRHGRRAAAELGLAAALPVAAGYAAFGGFVALRPVLAPARLESRASPWQLVTSLNSLGRATFLVHHLGTFVAAGVILVTVALGVRRLSADSPIPIITAGVAGYLFAAGYMLPWYLAWALPLAALDWSSRLSRLLFAESIGMLFAYEYRPSVRSDELDRLLHLTITGTQVLAFTACVAFVVGALLTASRRTPPVALPASHAPGR